MGILIDSSVLIGLERAHMQCAAFIHGREEEAMFVSVVSASELLHGVHRAKDSTTRAQRLAFVEAVLAALPVLEIDLATARCHAHLWSDLEKRGIMIGLHDSWLAATCLAHGLTLVTGTTREFARVPGLRVEHWE